MTETSEHYFVLKCRTNWRFNRYS